MKQMLSASSPLVENALKRLGFSPFRVKNETTYFLSNISGRVHVYLRPLGQERTLVSIHEDVGFGGYSTLHESPTIRFYMKLLKRALQVEMPF
jgi:hypothetical protein